MKQIENDKTFSQRSTKSEKSPPKEEAADFETAVSATGFGFFNFILLLVTVPSVFASQFETSSLSYVFPAAQCDLSLSLQDQGLVNAMIYTGMISSSFVWGPLTDVFGRCKILSISYILSGIFGFSTTFTPNLYFLLIAKFLGGFAINGSSTALTTFLSEFHGTKYRCRIPLMLGLLYNIASIILPLLAWAILHSNINFKISNTYELHSWNLFLLICSIPSLLSGILFIFMPESPKYLMSKGNNEKALQTFRKIFKFNTRKSEEDYPIRVLIDDKQIYQKKITLKDSWKQISPLFTSQYLSKLVLICLMMGFLLMCMNSLRLWLPQIFQLINDFDFNSTQKISFCDILNTLPESRKNSVTCSMNFDNSSVYVNSIIVAVSSVVGYILASVYVNKLGKKKMLIILGFLNGIVVASIYFAPNTTVALIFICIHLMCTGICVDLVITISVDLFPTYLRASALSLSSMNGRIGSTFGNLVFPVLLTAGCAAQFFTLAFIIIGCTFIALFLPNTDFMALK